MKKKLLIHICCATCAANVLKELSQNYEVTAFYYNPNIYPDSEYKIRMDEIKKFCAKKKIFFIEEKPDQERWFTLTKGHEQDPERGKRCTICYNMRLEKTAQYAKENDFDIFGTDLSISPHKDAIRLNKIGQELEQQYSVKYLVADFKKQDGFKKAMDMSKKHSFYRQNYCGCIFSMKARNI